TRLSEFPAMRIRPSSFEGKASRTSSVAASSNPMKTARRPKTSSIGAFSLLNWRFNGRSAAKSQERLESHRHVTAEEKASPRRQTAAVVPKWLLPAGSEWGGQPRTWRCLATQICVRLSLEPGNIARWAHVGSAVFLECFSLNHRRTRGRLRLFVQQRTAATTADY